jgi:membrane protease YdiL (CAAX protease family)
MESAWFVSLGLFAFLIAYAIYILFTYKIDPRYSLLYKKNPSFQKLLWLPSFEKSVLLLLLAVLALVPQRDLFTVFNLGTLRFTLYAVAFGGLGGVLIFVGGLPVNFLILTLRRRFSIQQTRREVELTQLLAGSMSKPPSHFFLNVFFASVFAAFLEEIIFRGYLLGHLLYFTLPVIAVVVQAIFAFVPQLYQGVYNGVLSLYGSLLFGVVFIISGSLLAVILAHLTQEVVGFAFTFSSTRKKKQDVKIL